MKYAQLDNEIIAYINGKAIIKDEFDNFFFIEIPREHITIGETAFVEDLSPIELLSAEEQTEILNNI